MIIHYVKPRKKKIFSNWTFLECLGIFLNILLYALIIFLALGCSKYNGPLGPPSVYKSSCNFSDQGSFVSGQVLCLGDAGGPSPVAMGGYQVETYPNPFTNWATAAVNLPVTSSGPATLNLCISNSNGITEISQSVTLQPGESWNASVSWYCSN